MYPVLSIDNIYSLIVEISFHTGVQVPDNRHQMRNDLFQIRYRPFFQCFRKNRVVCVSTCLSHNVHCRIHVKSSLHQQANKLRDHHRRMRIVDLNCHMIIQVVEIIPFFLCFCQNKLRRVADHKILLVNS